MRHRRFKLLTVTALMLAAPSALAQHQLRQAPPPPPMQFTPDRAQIQTPPPASPLIIRRDSARDALAAQPAPAPVAASPSPAPAAAAEADSPGIDLKGALDKLLAASDAQITEKLRGMIAGKQTEKKVNREPERAAIEKFYAARGYAPVWIKEGQLTARAKSAILRLKTAAADGLEAGDYPVPEFGTFTGAEALAEGDVTLSNSVLTYARHLQIGRIAPTRVSVEIEYGNHTPDPFDILKKIDGAGDVNATFESFNPPHAGFKTLKEKLAALRSNASADDAGFIPGGQALQPGMKDARVPALRAKLGLQGRPDDVTYDKALAAAVNRVQAKADIKGKGILDDRALALINGPKTSQQIDKIIANLERWRWLPRELGRTYVMVNVPDYTLKVVKDRDVVWRTKIVAGKPQTPTPLTTAMMDTVVVNPSWYVPQSIIQNELLPAYETDKNIFERMGLEVKRGPDGNINVVQPPGAANALGHIKFNFPNKYQVYLHDTPEKKLFAHEKRAFSHGCMRVEDPTKFGEVMLSMAMAGPTPDSRQISAMYGREEKIFKLTQRPMVHLTYQTAFVDDGGKLVIRDDVYGFDARIHTILTTDERKIADVAPPIDPKRDLATAKSNQEILRRVERREAQNPLAFFERLFR